MKKLILDVGAGVHPKGEINVDIVLKSNIHVQCDALSLPFPDNSFQLVRSQHVIEHVKAPYAFVKELTRVSSGYVYISCPNPHNFRTIIRDFLATHIRHYFEGHSAAELANMFQYAGLEVLQTSFFIRETAVNINRKLDHILKKWPRLNMREVQILGKKKCVDDDR
ncbi:MAG: methyltransferase domain-containing protein [Candidatus Heimdallarchaeota archaeon]